MSADRPRHARKEIRAFADELDRAGWQFETVGAAGHTIWSHPQAAGTYKLPETPRHFDVQRARREVARLLGQQVPGKRNVQAQREAAARERERARTAQPQRPAPWGPAVPAQRSPRRLPWEGQPDNYNRGIAALMREIPGGRR